MYFSWFCLYGRVYRLLAEFLVTVALDAWWVLCSGDRHRFKASVLRSLGDVLGLIGSFHKLVSLARPPTSTSLLS